MMYNMYNYTNNFGDLKMKKLIIIPNETKDAGLIVTKKLINTLKNKAEIYMEEKFTSFCLDVIYRNKSELYDSADIVIVLGGDGTMLNVAEPCGKMNIPILGINLGKVGFMAEVNVCDIESAVDAILTENFKIQKRMMLDISVIKKGEKTANYFALNDVVVAKSDSPMIDIVVYADDEKINEYKADGLIISTPTGSTGYSLSAGGPVADPSMELFIASPICAHNLHARPTLISHIKEIKLELSEELGHKAIVSVDGKVKENITLGDKIIVKKSDYFVDIIKIGSQSFYDVLVEKLK